MSIGGHFSKDQESAVKKQIAYGLELDQEGKYDEAEKEYIKAGELLFRVLPKTPRGSTEFNQMNLLFANIVDRMEQLNKLKETSAKKNKQSENIMNEIINTEVSYVQCLNAIQDIFIDPLSVRTKFYRKNVVKPATVKNKVSSRKAFSSVVLDDSQVSDISKKHMSSLNLPRQNRSPSVDTIFLSQQGSPTKDKEIIPIEKVNQLFMNVGSILAIHKNLLQDLNIMANPFLSLPTPKRAQVMAEIFLKYIPQFDCYTEYINRYAVAMDTLKTLSQENFQFQEFLYQAYNDPRCHLMEISDFLIMPVQRLPRYQLLLRELYQFLHPKGTDEHKTVEYALSQIKQIATYINDRKREADNTARLMRIHSKMRKKGSKVPILVPNRIIIKEGILAKVKVSQKKEKDMWVMIFNDLIILSKKTMAEDKKITIKYDLQTLILPQDVMQVTEIADPFANDKPKDKEEEYDISFYFKVKFRRSGKDYSAVFRTDTPLERREWIKQFQLVCTTTGGERQGRQRSDPLYSLDELDIG